MGVEAMRGGTPMGEGMPFIDSVNGMEPTRRGAPRGMAVGMAGA